MQQSRTPGLPRIVAAAGHPAGVSSRTRGVLASGVEGRPSLVVRSADLTAARMGRALSKGLFGSVDNVMALYTQGSES